jgi:hypothetical protein
MCFWSQNFEEEKCNENKIKMIDLCGRCCSGVLVSIVLSMLTKHLFKFDAAAALLFASVLEGVIVPAGPLLPPVAPPAPPVEEGTVKLKRASRYIWSK